ncbi:MAG TPA: urease accessory protein UreD [Burkholderiales bacterium]|nr:urease accessory protein UreD [Burkholderiales bacterium]
MQLAEPVAASWKASLSLGFQNVDARTVLAEKRSDGPLVVQKPLYPEGPGRCHAIVVHPPGGIAGGDELHLEVRSESAANALLTTPGASKWYRSAGAWAKQTLDFEVEGSLEWLPRETIVFDGALADLQSRITLKEGASYVGWEVVCLGRFKRGRLRTETRITQGGRMLFIEKGEIDGGGRLMQSPAGLGGRRVFGTFIATSTEKISIEGVAVTHIPGLLIGRYLGDSSEEALHAFTRLWKVLRPAAVEPRIWAT